MEAHIVKKSIQIHAEPAVVWDALTNPHKTKEYFFNCEVFSDWKEGSEIVFKGKMFYFIPIEMKGKILKVSPGMMLKYNLKNGKGDHVSTSTVTDELTFHNGITTLSITDDVGEGEGAEKRYKRSVKGWDKVLNGLKNFLENEN